MSNAAETAHRVAKALRLVATIDAAAAELGLTDDADIAAAVETLSDAWWATVAAKTGDKPPSDETRAAALQVLRGRAANPDPFAAWDAPVGAR